MDTASFQFVAFGLSVALISNISRSRVWRSLVLLGASLIVLGQLAQHPMTLIPLVGFLLLSYFGLALIQRGRYKIMSWSILATLLIYVWLKKYTFLPEGILLHEPYFTLGLSYMFFRVLHLLIDTGGGDQRPRIGLGSYILYVLNFTTLVSGPVQRYEEFAQDQFAVEPIALGPRIIGLQLERIVRGFFKVNVLALLLHAMQEDALAQMSQPLPLSLKMYAAFRLAVLYPYFLYGNFSGYIDIVMGLARLMRVRLSENFDRPFSASSFIDFWTRWHMTLSAWFRSYVYNPLLVLLMRRISSLSLQPILGVLCFFVTFFLVGIWHGRTSEFVVFGLLQGGGISINKLWQIELSRFLGRKGYKELAKNPIYIALGRGMTFSWFAFTLFWFWANWKQIDRVFTSISLPQWIGVWTAIWLSATVVLAAWEWLRAALLSLRTTDGPMLTSRYARVVYASALGLAAVVMTVLLNQPAPGIVYKAF